MALQAPWPYWGGKATVASDVWQRLGKPDAYVEPFCGTAAVLLANPYWPDVIETVNDAWAFIPNFYRAIKADPDEVAWYADERIDEVQMHAIHAVLAGERSQLAARLEGDPDYYDARTAGQWVWLMSMWIGQGCCSGRGAWSVDLDEEGYKVLVKKAKGGSGVSRQRQHVTSKQGIFTSRAMPEVASERGVRKDIARQMMHLTSKGQGVNRKRFQMHEHGAVRPVDLYDWFQALSYRFRNVRVLCGDWSRAVTPSVTTYHGIAAVFLDPPYSDDQREGNLYAQDSFEVAHDARKWCLENGDNPQLRIALAGYASEHDELEDLGWERFEWKANGGYGNQGKKPGSRGKANAAREVIWFSPYCIKPGDGSVQLSILDGLL